MDNLDFLNAIANGFNPYTGEKFTEGDILLNPQVVARLYELCNELNADRTDEKVIRRNAIELCYPYTSIQPFAKAISNALYGVVKFGIIQNEILNFLTDDNKLEYRYPYPTSQRMVKYATKEGEQIGIINAEVESPYGKMQHKILYTPQAQCYIIDRLSDIFKSINDY